MNLYIYKRHIQIKIKLMKIFNYNYMYVKTIKIANLKRLIIKLEY